MIEITSKITINPDMSLTFTAQTHGRPEVIDEARKLVSDHNSFCNLKVTSPRRPRSTGYRSQNSHFYGHVGDLVKQETNPYLKSEAVMAWCLLCKSIDRGLPSVTTKTGIRIPKPTSLHDTFESNISIETAHQYADENDRWLTEYSDETPPRAYKSKGGRSLKEMLEKYPELNQELRVQPVPEMDKQGQTQEQEPQESTPETEKIDPDANIEQGDIDSFFDGIF